MSPIRVLVAVKPRALQRLIEYLFRNRPELKVVARVSDGGNLAPAIRRASPDLIVANSKLFGGEINGAVAALKRSHPESKLIVLCSVDGFAREVERRGADACLAEESVGTELLETVWALSEPEPVHERLRAAGPAPRSIATQAFPKQQG